MLAGVDIMAQCVQSVQEFVQDSFVPMVAVLCSEEAERVTRKNKLGFAELLRPFCRLTSEGRRERDTGLSVSQLSVSQLSVSERGSVFSCGGLVSSELAEQAGV